MKRFVLILGVSLFFSCAIHAQFVHWTFEASIPTGSGPYSPEVGTGSASGFHADGATAYSNPVGNGSAESYSSDRWAVGDYYQFQFSTTGFQDISITWDATGSNTGPRDFKVQYSTNGTTFTDATGTNSTYSLNNNGWNSGTYNPVSTRTLDLSSVTSLNNASAIYIRLVCNSSTAINGGAIATAGTNRVDDFKVSGNIFSSNTITVTTVNPLTYNLPDCFTSATGTVDFTSVGTFTAGNVYTAELSDATGAFGSPVNLGTLSSTANAGTINITIPAGTASSALYKIRIRSDNPVVTSSLSADITINQAGSCNSASTDYFRSVATGDWNSTSTWETSATGGVGTWISATLTPTSTANTIQIRNGHTVSITSTENADQVVIENGGTLNHVSGVFTINDGSGDDVDIQNGGVFHLSSSGNPPQFGSGTPVVNVATGAILRVSASGHTSAAPANGVNAANYLYQHQSVLEYTLSGGFSTSNVTFFPNVNATTIPIFRATNPTISNLIVGANNPTTFNGIFEYTSITADLIWQNSGDKIFRNGIRGAGNFTANASAATAKFIINGETAELGGTGSLVVPSTGGLEIGSALNNTTLTVTANKTVTGNVTLVSTNTTYVDLGTNNLTVSGTVSGGTTTSYIRTASSGSLILQSVGTKDFPVGHSKYNPITIHTGSSHDWTVNVNDGVTADIPQTTLGAVLATWNITPSVNPPAAPTNITFYFDSTLAGGQIGADFNTAPHNSPNNVQVWHRKLGWWLASGTTVPVDPGTPIAGYVSATALNAQDFSPYGISRVSLPLPIRLVNFSATKISSSLAIINWELAACCSKDALFELERSANGQHFSLLSSISGSETNKYYFYNDSRLSKGTNYYRLKMMDTDGSVKYSKIIAIVNDEKGFVITAVAPNPVQHTASLTISAAKNGSINFTVYDLHGTVVKQWQSNVAAGVNVVTMDVASLANGMYHVLAASPDGRTVTRFMKQ